MKLSAALLSCCLLGVAQHAAAQRIRSFHFKDLDGPRDNVIDNTLTEQNTVVDFETIGTDRLNIDFEVNAVTESVLVTLDNPPISYCENLAPFSLLRDIDGVFEGQPFPLGRRTVTATAYDEKRCRGNAGSTFQRSFIVRSGSPAAPVPPPVPAPVPAPSPPSNNNGQRPNLIVIMTDQQRWDAMSFAGNPVLNTPNMDRVAREGVFFTNAYTSSAVCGPARTSLFTGLSIENTGVRRNDETGNPTMRSYDQILVQDQGYRAEYYGKFHMPARMSNAYQNSIDTKSFNIFRPFRQFLVERGYQFPAVVPPGYVIDSMSLQPYLPNAVDTRFGRTDLQETPRCECDQYGSSILARTDTIDSMYGFATVEAISRLARNRNQPFSLHTSFNSPHAPHTPPKFYTDFFPPQNMPIPPSIDDVMVDSPYQRERKARFSNPATVGHMISVYYAQVLEADVWLGNILRTIDEAGIANNTMLVFTTDHGEMLGSHGMIEKNVFYEESVRVPMMIRFPGEIRAGARVDEPVSHRDLFATILDYLGVPSRPSNGFSLRRYIERTASPVGAFAVAEGGANDELMLRTGNYKLIIPNTANSQRFNVLYNLRDDPFERENLIGRSNPARRNANLARANELKDMLLQWCIDNNSPHTAAVRNRQL